MNSQVIFLSIYTNFRSTNHIVLTTAVNSEASVCLWMSSVTSIQKKIISGLRQVTQQSSVCWPSLIKSILEYFYLKVHLGGEYSFMSSILSQTLAYMGVEPIRGLTRIWTNEMAEKLVTGQQRQSDWLKEPAMNNGVSECVCGRHSRIGRNNMGMATHRSWNLIGLKKIYYPRRTGSAWPRHTQWNKDKRLGNKLLHSISISFVL